MHVKVYFNKLSKVDIVYIAYSPNFVMHNNTYAQNYLLYTVWKFWQQNFMKKARMVYGCILCQFANF